jgi:hypothetical protein
VDGKIVYEATGSAGSSTPVALAAIAASI